MTPEDASDKVTTENDDRAWFAAHTGETYRMRLPDKQEQTTFDAEDDGLVLFDKQGETCQYNVMVVRQLEPGVRMRLGLVLRQFPLEFNSKRAERLYKEAEKST
jgi:hypothetical protein